MSTTIALEKNEIHSSGSRSCIDEDGFYKPGSVREVGAYIALNRIGAVDTVTQTFNAQFELQLTWPCTKEDLENFEKDKQHYVPSYVPRLTFPNAESMEKTIVQTKNEGYRVSRTGSLDSWGNKYTLAIPYINDCLYIIKGTFVEVMELQNYPVDCQDLTIVIELQESAEHTVLIPSHDVGQPVVNIGRKYACIPEFIMHPPVIEFTTNLYDVHYPAINLRLKLERRFRTQMLKMVGYLSIIALASLSIFSLDHIEQINDRLNIIFTLMLTAVAFQFIVSLSIPNIPYLTLLDVYVLFVFGFIFVLGFAVCIVGYVEAPVIIDQAIFLIITAFYFIFSALWFLYTAYARNFNELPKLKYSIQDYKALNLDDESTYEVLHHETVIEEMILKKMSSYWEMYLKNPNPPKMQE